jgi:hypothetical protein
MHTVAATVPSGNAPLKSVTLKTTGPDSVLGKLNVRSSSTATHGIHGSASSLIAPS